MSTNKEEDIYLKEGKLDLSILNEEMIKPLIKEQAPEGYNSILDDLESMDLNNMDIATTLEEMALMFEEDDEYNKAFNQQRLEEEKKEFDKRDWQQ